MAIIQKKLIGIDVGTENIKMVNVAANGKIRSFASVPLPEGVIVNGRVESAKMLTETLKAARKKLHANNINCAMCINSPDAVIRQILLPKMEKRSLDSTVENELAGFLPIDVKQYTIDYVITDEIDENDKSQFVIQVFAVPTDIVKVYADCVKKAGFQLKFIDVMENTNEKLYRMLTNKGMMPEGSIANLYIDNSRALVLIYGKGKFFISKVLDNGIRRLSSEIAEKTKKPIEAVKKLLYEQNLLGDNEEYLIEKGILENYARHIVFEVLRVTDYYKSRFRNDNISGVYLTGGFTHIRGITQYFEEYLGLPVITVSGLMGKFYRKYPELNTGVDYTNAFAVTLRNKEE